MKKTERMLSYALSFAMLLGMLKTVHDPVTAKAEGDVNSEPVYKQDFEDPNLEIGFLPDEITAVSAGDSAVSVFCDDGNKVLKIDHQEGTTQMTLNLPQALTNGVYDVEYKFKNVLHGAYISEFMSVLDSSYCLLVKPGAWYQIYFNCDEGNQGIRPANYATGDWFLMKMRINIDNGNVLWYLDGSYASTQTLLTGISNDLSKLRFICESTGKYGVADYMGSADMEGWKSGKGTYYIDDITVTKVDDLAPTSLTVENGSTVGTDIGSITAGFNYIIDPDTVSTQTVQLYKGETRIQEGYTVYSSGAALVIIFADPLDKNASYSVRLNGVMPQDTQYSSSPSELVHFNTLGYTFLADLPVNDGQTFRELDTFPEFSSSAGVTYNSVTVTKGGEITTIRPGEVLTDIGNYAVTVVGTKDGVQEERTVEFSVAKYDGMVFCEDFEEYNEGDRTLIQQGTEYCDRNIVVQDGADKALKVESYPYGPCSSLEKLSLGGTYTSGVYEFSAKVRFLLNGFAGSDFASLYNTQNAQRIVQPHTWADRIYHDKTRPELGGPTIEELGGCGANSAYFTITHKIDFDNGTHELYYDDINMAVPEDAMTNLSVDSMLFGFYVDWGNVGANGYEAERYQGSIIYIDEISVKKVGLEVIKQELTNSADEVISDLSYAAGQKVKAKVLLRETDTKTDIGDYMVITALYDKGQLIDVCISDRNEINTNDGYVVSLFDIPQDTSNCRLSYMIFDNLENIRPLKNKADF